VLRTVCCSKTACHENNLLVHTSARARTLSLLSEDGYEKVLRLVTCETPL
jgi:hypothetical protein